MSLCVCVSVCLLERLPVALRIRNLLATHCETILLRYFVAVNNALVYLLSGEAWQREGTQGGAAVGVRSINNDNSFTARHQMLLNV